MSALGDYIHLRAANYAAHGTTMRGTYDAIGSYENYKKKRAAAIKEIKPATIATLKQRLKKDSGIQEKKDKVNNEPSIIISFLNLLTLAFWVSSISFQCKAALV